MWKKLLKLLARPALTVAEPELAKLIEKDKAQLIKSLQEADGKTIAKQLCDKIREALQ